MAANYRWETRQIRCPEAERRVGLLLAWEDIDERAVLCSVHCDNSSFRTLNNWECQWTCWDSLAGESEH